MSEEVAALFDVAHLSSPTSPWILGFAAGSIDKTAIRDELGRRGITAWVLQGSEMRRINDLFDQFALQLDFPEYFGRNWHALTDCLADLGWAPGVAYVVVIQESRYLLTDSRESALNTFLGLIRDVAAGWAIPVNLGEDFDRPTVPFHLVLHESPTFLPMVRERLRNCGVELPETFRRHYVNG